MLERLLAHSFVASDVLQITCYYLANLTNSKGAFISVRSLDYFDSVVGSIREKRIGSNNKEHINMQDINNINNQNGDVVNVKDVIFVKSDYGWYVGLDGPAKSVKDGIFYSINELKDIVNKAIAVAYPVFNHCVKQENKPNQYIDFLTGTLTRAALFHDIQAFIQTIKARNYLPLWLFYMDFNNFKAVNDSLGHDMGDQVLKSIAMEIRSIFAGYGSVYRLGGDEFVGLCFGVDEEVAYRIKQRIESVTRQAPCGLFVNVAVSVEKFDESEYEGLAVEKVADKFIQKCENGMYTAKYLGKKINNIDCSKCKFYQK